MLASTNEDFETSEPTEEHLENNAKYQDNLEETSTPWTSLDENDSDYQTESYQLEDLFHNKNGN